MPKITVGLTGGMGSGKSTVLQMMKEMGAAVVDSDSLVHEILNRNKNVLAAIQRKFGPVVFNKDGGLNRGKLAELVFKSRSKRRFLEGLIHPLVRKEIFIKIKTSKNSICVVDVPLLYESGWAKRFNAVIVVQASLKKRFVRLRKKGFSSQDIKRRIHAQWPLEKKVEMANFVVNNDNTRTETQKQVDIIWKLINPQKR